MGDCERHATFNLNKLLGLHQRDTENECFYSICIVWRSAILHKAYYRYHTCLIQCRQNFVLQKSEIMLSDNCAHFSVLYSSSKNYLTMKNELKPHQSVNLVRCNYTVKCMHERFKCYHIQMFWMLISACVVLNLTHPFKRKKKH